MVRALLRREAEIEVCARAPVNLLLEGRNPSSLSTSKATPLISAGNFIFAEHNFQNYAHIEELAEKVGQPSVILKCLLYT